MTAAINQGGLHPGVVIALWALAIPLLVFLGQCSRVGAPARDRRLAAMRMAGASPRQAVRVAATESGVAAALGAVVGLAIYFVGGCCWTSVLTVRSRRTARTTGRAPVRA